MIKAEEIGFRLIGWPLFLTLFLISACGGGNGNSDGQEIRDTVQEPIDPNKSNLVNVSGELFSIPSPVQTTLLIRKLGLGMRSDITNPIENATRYSSKTQKALNMGVYGADLGYMTVFNNSQGALDYLKTVQVLADELDVSNAFEPELIRRFSNGIGNEDSLLIVAGEAFRASDAYLKRNDRNEIAALVLAGGWIESFYFSVISAGDNPDGAIMKRIAEQKAPLNNLIELLIKTDTEGEYKDLVDQLIDLKVSFSDVDISYHFEHPTVVVEEKTTYVNSHTEVDISDDQLKSITDKLMKIRNSIVA